MKQPIRFFSVGLLIASVMLLIVYILDNPSQAETDTTELDTDELIEALEVEGYHVLSSSEYIKLSVGRDNNNDEKTDSDEKDKDSDKNDSKDNGNDDNKEKDKDKTKSDDKDKKKDDNKDNNDSSSSKSNKKKDDDTNSDKDDVKKYTLTIESNMLGLEISELLYDNDIIDDAEKFNRYLEVEGYAPYIQLGEFEVSNDMEYKEIADIIAKN